VATDTKTQMTVLPLDGESLDYVVVDVFVGESARPFEGNPLAVVLGADELTTAQCQALAVEFHLSETVFPMAPTAAGAAAGADYRARIFTIASELPFAGHPSVGVAWTLARLGKLAPGTAVQECPVGLVTLEIPAGLAGDVASGTGTPAVRLTGPIPEVSDPIDPQPLLDAVGLLPSDLAGPPPRLSGTGLRFAYLNVRPDAVARAYPNLAALAALDSSATGVQVFALPEDTAAITDKPATDQPIAVHARVMAADIAEDPATGSAAIALSGWLLASDIATPDGQTRYTIRQGIEMGRPSVLTCDVTASCGVIERVRVSGRVAAVATGRVRIP
jgi:trans-2,3-dihydro-3-hydroxyanthranilate isomerase